MKITRRMLLGTSGVAILAAVAWPMRLGVADMIANLMEKNFGSAITQSVDGQEFQRDFMALLDRHPPGVQNNARDAFRWRSMGIPVDDTVLARIENLMISEFLRSTNVAQIYPEAGALVYTGLFDPYENPCANQLSANFLT